MGTDDIFKRNRTLKRTVGKRGKPKPTILIVCEGEQTEPNYFNAFRIRTVKVEGEGKNTKSLVKSTIDIKKSYLKDGEKFDQVWCVFDRDDFPTSNFNDAFTLASKHNIKVAYSNESFELWYLLHFNFLESALTRQQYCEKLSRLLGKVYQKNDISLYEILLEKQQNAIRNSKALLSNFDSFNPDRNNPSTTVHLLVEELLKIKNS